jgi:hypothetical protein
MEKIRKLWNLTTKSPAFFSQLEISTKTDNFQIIPISKEVVALYIWHKIVVCLYSISSPLLSRVQATFLFLSCYHFRSICIKKECRVLIKKRVLLIFFGKNLV